jgi:hypothetical protein
VTLKSHLKYALIPNVMKMQTTYSEYENSVSRRGFEDGAPTFSKINPEALPYWSLYIVFTSILFSENHENKVQNVLH